MKPVDLRPASGGPLRILTADTLITDCMVKEEDTGGLAQKYHGQGKLLPDGKMQITRGEFEAFNEAIDGRFETKAPGGSSFNTTVTLSRLLGNRVAVQFMGVLGLDEDSIRIAKTLEEAHIKLLPLSNNHDQFAQPPEAASSIVVMYPDRRRATATYPGTAKQYLVSDMVTEKRVQDCDVVFLQGSLWQKLDETFPVPNGHAEDRKLGFADMLMKQRWLQGKDLWFALPTQSDYGTIKRTHSEKAAHFRHVMAESNVILGNSEELARAYTYDDEYKTILRIIDERGIAGDLKESKDNPDPVARLLERGKLTEEEVKSYDFMNRSVQAETAYQRLRNMLAQQPLLAASRDENHHEGAWKGNTDQMAFITCGRQGSVVVTAAGIERFAATSIDPSEIVNTVGAGDTAFAGFLAGYASHLPPAGCARIAAEMAGAKLRHNGATLPDPQKVLEEEFPHLAHEWNRQRAPKMRAAAL